MRTGRAGRHHRMVGAFQPVLDRDIAGSEINQTARNEEWRHFSRSPLLEQDRRVGDARQPADAGPDQRARRAAFVLRRGVPVRVIERLARRAHCKDDEIVDLALVLRLHPLVGIEGAIRTVAAGNDAGDPAGQIRDVERLDLPRVALAIEDTRPARLDATAEWRNHAQPRDDHPSHLQTSSPKPAADNKKPGDRTTTARPASSPSARASAPRVLFEKLRSVADGQNRLGGIIRNFTTEFFFKRHHELDGIETIGAEVINEARVVDHFFGFNTKVFDHDLLNPLANLTHRSTSCLFHWSRPPDDTQDAYKPSWSLSFLRTRALSRPCRRALS